MYYSDTDRITPNITDNALKVLSRRYLRGETPEQMFDRVAKIVAEADRPYVEIEIQQEKIDKLANRFYNMMASLDFLPNSPTLMNADRDLGQLAACFVVPVGDSMEGIFQAIKDMAMIQKTGGGTGFSFSRLRPKGDPVSSTIGEASGPVSFMRVFNSATEAVKQGGARRGANMGILRVDHPDILEFINCKSDTKELTNFNISVGITDEFMSCLLEGKAFTLRFNNTPYAEIDPEIIWEKLVDRSWNTGEPGIVFLDRLNEDNPTPQLGDIEATNPCGEQPLLPYEACNLGSINLAHMVKKQPRPESVLLDNIDWSKLEELSQLATYFLDNVIDINKYPLPENEKIALGNRKIGLGIMGFADMLLQLRVPYDSPEAIILARKIMEFIQRKSHEMSNALAQMKGCFPNWENSVWHKSGIPMRNATTTTIAPTGTLSIIAGVSSGVEPLFALYYEKELVYTGEKLPVLNEHLNSYLDELGYSQEDKDVILEEIITTGTTSEVAVARIFKTAHDIHPNDHVRIQAAFQEYTDNAVSKTINFNHEVTRDEISETLKFAWENGCKGITVYRDGSRESQPMTRGDRNRAIQGETLNDKLAELEDIERYILMQKSSPKKRPDEVSGKTRQVPTGCGTMFVTVNSVENQIYEVFLKASSTGGCSAFTEGTARLISIALRYGVPVEEIIDQLNSVRCDNFRYQSGKNPNLKGKSCPDVVGRVMADCLIQAKEVVYSDNAKHFVPREILENIHAVVPTADYIHIQLSEDGVTCPDCGSRLQQGEGCIVCRNCGYSRC